MEVANALHGTSDSDGDSAGGTANVLSAELEVPGQLEAAAQLITDPSARIQPVDMGNLGDRLFFHLSAGLLGGLSNRADRAAKDQNGFLAYLLSGLKELQRCPAPSIFRLNLDDRSRKSKALAAWSPILERSALRTFGYPMRSI